MSCSDEPIIGVYIVEILSYFGLTIDTDSSTDDCLIMNNDICIDDDIDSIPLVNITKREDGVRDIVVADELVLSYDNDVVILPKPIMLHDLLIKIFDLCGWGIANIPMDEKKDDVSFTRISSVVAPRTHNVVLVLSDYRGEHITESRLAYCNKTILRIEIIGDSISVVLPTGIASEPVTAKIKVANK